MYNLENNELNLSIAPYNGSLISMPTIYVLNDLNRELILQEDNGIQLGEKFTKKRITTINELRNEFQDLIERIIDEFFSTRPHKYRPNFLGDDVIELLVNQLIFDVLFDKYKDGEKMTSHDYSTRMSEMLSISTESINKKIKKSMGDFYSLINKNASIQQLITLGVDVETCNSYYTNRAKDNMDNKKPKCVWDAYFYNNNMITGRQYRRQLKRDGNYPYKTFCKDLNKYNEFVKKILPKENETPKIYFNKTMDYYYLESYKRVDFIFKILNILSIASKKFDKVTYSLMDGGLTKVLIARYTPPVWYAFEKNNQISLLSRYKYYMPLLIIENEIYNKFGQKSQLTGADFNQFIHALNSYRYIRAMTYEKFNYRCEYVIPASHTTKKTAYSNDYLNYKEIKDFLIQHYNMQSYHETTEIWNIIENIDLSQKDSDEYKHFIETLRGFIKINNLLFPASSKRKTK